jgi:hypothetical protein
MVKSGSTPNVFIQPLLQEVFSLLQCLGWRTSVYYVYRGTNRCADMVANLEHSSLDFNCNFLDVSHFALKLILEDDLRGVSLPRFV